MLFQAVGVGVRSVPARPTPTPLCRCSGHAPQASSGNGVAEAERAQPPGAARVVEVGLRGGRRRREVLLGGGSSSSSSHQAPQQGAHSSEYIKNGSGPVAAVRDFFLPRGWPHSVTPDYLQYQLVTVPAHITGWLSHSLATSSMIQALGMGISPAATVATSAAIKWITKDGLGAAGRLIVGGRLASVFDEDPRRWRMVAEGVSTLGLALEIATQVYPAQFVLLAGSGTLAKSMAKGMGRPCFRVIQTHFSATNNVGDVAAKEEVWEVAAQLAGLASSVLLLQTLQAAGHPEAVIPAWAAAHSVHVVLRYTALRALRFPYPNQKRAALMTSSHVSTGRVPSIDEANAEESILLPPSSCRPRVVFGCSLDEVLAAAAGAGSSTSGSSSSHSSNSSNGSSSTSNGAAMSIAGPAEQQQQQKQKLGGLLQLYAGEQYLLTWHDGTAWVALLEGAGKTDMLRAVYQAAWLDHHCLEAEEAGAAASSSNGASSSSSEADFSSLAASLAALRQRWPDFEAQAAAQGWQLDKAVLPQGQARLRLE